MGLSSVLSTAVTGLGAAETTIDVVGNNIANSNTVGFKASSVVFATQFLQTLSLGSAPSEGSGGTNPRQTGLGTQIAAITPDFGQGTVQISSSPTDFAIQDNGFFIIEGAGGERLYTRNGQFDLNANNELATKTGERLLGYGVDDNFQIQETELVPIQIPLGSALVAEATQNVSLAGNLSPTGEIATTAEIIQSAVLGDASFSAPTTDISADEAAVPNISGSPSMSGAVNGATTGSMAAGTYLYKVAFVDTNGLSTPTESLASVNSLSVAVGAATNSVTLSNIPTAAQIGGLDSYAGRQIYRSDDGGATYRLVGTIANNTATSFTDTSATGSTTLNQQSLTGDYSYYVTWATALGGPGTGTESRPTQVAGPINVSAQRIQLRDLPVDPPGGDAYLVRRIYRNSASEPNVFRFLEEIPNNSANQTFTDGVQDSAIASNAVLDLDGPKITTGTLLTNVLRREDNGTYVNAFEIGTIEFDVRKGLGTDKPRVATKSFEVTSSTTVNQYLQFLQESFGIVAPPGPDGNNTVPTDITGLSAGAGLSNGRIRIIANNGANNAIQIGNNSMSLEGGGNIDLGFSSVQTAVGGGAVTTFQVFDSLGVALDVRLTVTLERRSDTETVYRWFADSDDNSPSTGSKINIGTGLLRFDGSGRLADTSNSTVSIDRRNIPSTSPMNFALDFNEVTGLATQTNTLSAPRADGFPPGQLTGFIVSESGVITGVFDNGVQRDLGQMRLARFANPNGLEQKGRNAYASGVNSGLPIEGNPGEQGIGTLIAGALELSNTDIGKSLIDLILASTQYRGNSRVITAAQQLLDELMNLRR